MSYYDKILKETVKFLKSYGVTQADIDECGCGTSSYLYEDGDVSKYGISGAYESIISKLSEDVSNYINFTEKDLIEACHDACFNNFDSFVKIMETQGWDAPVIIPPEIEDEYDLLKYIKVDSDFRNELFNTLSDAIIYDWPELDISVYYGDRSDEFWEDVYSLLDKY